MNVLYSAPETKKLSAVFNLLGQTSRFQILLAIGSGTVCVCQLEAILGQRQAYISQQLMLLRDAGLVETERSGRHIFYHVSDLRWLDLVKQAATIMSVDLPTYKIPEIQGCNFTPSDKQSPKT